MTQAREYWADKLRTNDRRGGTRVVEADAFDQLRASLAALESKAGMLEDKLSRALSARHWAISRMKSERLATLKTLKESAQELKRLKTIVARREHHIEKLQALLLEWQAPTQGDSNGIPQAGPGEA